MRKGLTYVAVFLLFYTIAFVLSVALTWKDYSIMLSSGIYISVFVLQFGVLAFAKKNLMKRTIVKEGGGYMVFPIGAMMSATMVTAAVGRVLTETFAPQWTSYLGIAFLFTGYLIAISAFNAAPPHAALRYGEQQQQQGGGPYDIIRCPVELAAILIVLSIPLYFGYMPAFIPAGVSAALIIVQAALKDHWRFVNYEYYYDYTKRVSYVLVPLIW